MKTVATLYKGKVYKHDEEGLALLQAEHPDIFEKIIKIDEKKEEEKEAPKKAKTKK